MKTVKIKIIPCRISGNVLETHIVKKGMLLEQWLIDNVDDYEERCNPPIVIMHKKRVLPPSKWATHKIRRTLRIIVEPKGFIFIATLTTAAAGAYVLDQLLPPVPDANANSVPTGSSIYNASAQANKARLMAPFSYLFGEHKLYPDKVMNTWTEYINNKAVAHYALRICEGRCTHPDVYIGNTKISSLGTDAKGVWVEPGETIPSANKNRLNMYVSDEVGPTSNDIGIPLTRIEDTPDDIEITKDFHRIFFSNGQIYKGSTTQWPYLKFYIYKNNAYKLDPVGYLRYGQEIIISGTNGNNGTWIVDRDGASNFVTNKQNGARKFRSNGYENATIKIIGSKSKPTKFFSCAPLGETVNTIYVDLIAPQGICTIDGASLKDLTIRGDIEYITANGNRKIVDISKTGNKTDQYGWTIRFHDPDGIVSARIIQYFPAEDPGNFRDKIVWQGLRSELKQITKYEHCTTYFLTLTGVSDLARGVRNKINVTPTRIGKDIVNGKWVDNVPVKSIAGAIYYVLDDSNQLEMLDTQKLVELHSKWKARGMEFNAVIDGMTTAKQILDKILQCGFSSNYIDNGKIAPLLEASKTRRSQMLTPRLLTKPVVEDFHYHQPNAKDAVIVEYVDPETWRATTVTCSLRGDNYIPVNPVKIRLFGCTNKTQAWRFGMRFIRRIVYVNASYAFQTELDSLISSPGDLITIPVGDSQTGVVDRVVGDVIYADHPIVLNTNSTSQIMIRKRNGSPSDLVTITQAGDGVRLASPIPGVDFSEVDEFEFVFMLGSGSWHKEIVINKMIHAGETNMNIKAVEYVDRKYDDDFKIPA